MKACVTGARGFVGAHVAAAMAFVDVEDVAGGHVRAAERGRDGEHYILGGDIATWPELIARTARVSGASHPVVVLPAAVARVGRMREVRGLPGVLPAEGIDRMGRDGSGLSRVADAVGTASRLGLLAPLDLAQRVAGRSVVVGR